MEHEVFVPVPADSLRRTLADPARVARCVPGLQQDADASAGPLVGRLKVRVGGHTITYRGALRITEREGGFAVEGEGTEARGHGSAKLALTVRLTGTEGGTTLAFTGSAHADGRLADAAPGAAEQAATRLLDRFASSLGAATEADGKRGAAEGAESAASPDTDTGKDSGASTGTGAGPEAAGGATASGAAAAKDSGEDSGEAGRPDDAAGAAAPDPGDDPATAPAEAGGALEDALDDEGPDDGSVGDDAVDEGPMDQGSALFEVDVPPSSLDPLADEVFGEDEEPPAEAAHARRTMIGRSAEEVDHAPPRGRYAPVPAPQPASAGSTLRWAAPAAALAIASAVVVGRALRRRR
ncbi:SRPBCC domain-containing protein [Streptomyces chengbuensis]|uniref:SRPBCC domain-containing protein n=1 Tax=Streptomyces TaxID=1883 RepID=UPI0025B3A193|nr:SRPBCC domain-containing protein [Streptomyces sp. HUAS CB01]WJY51656.1 SRPBCC domain-containing protein [Streptomyces sp. HUAS CB01]